jgi:aryl-alcohol dehydrogenase-like predicted oxidoreductase
MNMEHRPLGRTGVQVSKLCLGTMMFGAWGNTDHEDSVRIIHRALDAGINFIDTADVYSAGESEEIVGKALKDRRDDVVLATKFFMPMGDDPNRRGGSRRWIIRAVEDSLRRLGTDWIDLYQVHRPDPAVDVAPPPRRRASASPSASTCRCRRTSASSRRCRRSPGSPTTPACR